MSHEVRGDIDPIYQISYMPYKPIPTPNILIVDSNDIEDNPYHNYDEMMFIYMSYIFNPVPIIFYMDEYMINPFGQVWSIKNNILLVPSNFYRKSTISLCKDNVKYNYYIEDLVSNVYLTLFPNNIIEYRDKISLSPADSSRSRLTPYKINSSNMKMNHYTRQVKAIHISTGTVIFYNSIKEAAENIGCAANHISEVCRGKKLSIGGFKWEYLDAYENF